MCQNLRRYAKNDGTVSEGHRNQFGVSTGQIEDSISIKVNNEYQITIYCV